MAPLLPCPVCGAELTARTVRGHVDIDCAERHRATSDPTIYELARVEALIAHLNDFAGVDLARICSDGGHAWSAMPAMAELARCSRCATFAGPPRPTPGV